MKNQTSVSKLRAQGNEMNRKKQANTVEEIMSALPADAAAAAGTTVDWRTLGQVLSQLDAVSQVASDGRTWVDVVHHHMKEIGAPVSKGHLHKVRRAYAFLVSGIDFLELPADRKQLAKISSVELAQRLYQHDTEAGMDALAACLDNEKPAALWQIQELYDEYIHKHPDAQNPLQAAWKMRRNAKSEDSSLSADQPSLKADKSNFDQLLAQVSAHMDAMTEKLRDRDAQIQALRDDAAEAEVALTQVEQHLALALDEIKSLKHELLKANLSR